MGLYFEVVIFISCLEFGFVSHHHMLGLWGQNLAVRQNYFDNLG